WFRRTSTRLAVSEPRQKSAVVSNSSAIDVRHPWMKRVEFWQLTNLQTSRRGTRHAAERYAAPSIWPCQESEGGPIDDSLWRVPVTKSALSLRHSARTSSMPNGSPQEI